MTIGARIKQLRLEKGWTQKKLGEKCGMADSAIRRYESDRGNPTEKTLLKIAEALGVYVVELLPPNEFDKVSPEMKIADYVLKFYEHEDYKNPELNEAFEKFKKDLGIRIDTKFNEEINKTEYNIYLFDKEEMLVNIFRSLNDKGQEEAVKRIEELAELEKYQQKQPPESILGGGEYKDTNKTEKPSEMSFSPSDGK